MRLVVRHSWCCSRMKVSGPAQVPQKIQAGQWFMSGLKDVTWRLRGQPDGRRNGSGRSDEGCDLEAAGSTRRGPRAMLRPF